MSFISTSGWFNAAAAAAVDRVGRAYDGTRFSSVTARLAAEDAVADVRVDLARIDAVVYAPAVALPLLLAPPKRDVDVDDAGRLNMSRSLPHCGNVRVRKGMIAVPREKADNMDI